MVGQNKRFSFKIKRLSKRCRKDSNHSFTGQASSSKRLTSNLHILITKTCLYIFDPLKPHFYIVKLGFTGVFIIFLISAQNIDCGYSLEPPRRGGSNEYSQSMFSAES